MPMRRQKAKSSQNGIFMNKVFLGVCLFLLASCMSVPQGPEKPIPDPRISQSHLEMGFEDLSQIGHFLLKAAEKEENRCVIPQKKISEAPRLYRAFVDEKYSVVQDAYLNKPLKEKVAFWNSKCALSCSCDVYVGFSEYLRSFNFFLSATELQAVEKIKLLQAHEVSRIPVCMQQSSWVCESRVLKDVLRKIN